MSWWKSLGVTIGLATAVSPALPATPATGPATTAPAPAARGAAASGSAATAVVARRAAPRIPAPVGGRLVVSTVVLSPARLVGDGTSVEVSVRVLCTGGGLGTVSLEVEQGPDRRAWGSGGTTVRCTSVPVRLLLPVRSQSGQPFLAGAASAFARGYACVPTGCTWSEDGSAEIQLRR